MKNVVIVAFLFALLTLSIISAAAQSSTTEEILNEESNVSCFDTSCGELNDSQNKATTSDISAKSPADSGKKTMFWYIVDYTKLGYTKIKKGTAYYLSKIRARFELLGARKGQGGGAIRG